VSTYNKAFAVRDWFENGDGRTFRGADVAILVDADMILMQAFDDRNLPDADLIQ
jgi:hypothetical protein